MKKFLKKHYVFAIIVVLLALAVYSKQTDNIKKHVGQEQKNTPLTETKTIKDSNDFYTITAKYPVDSLDAKKVVEQYVKNLVAQKQEEWKIGGEVYNDEQSLTKEFPDRASIKYELAIDYKSYASQKLGTRTYVLTNYEFTGGAHGNTGLATFTFSKGGHIAIEDIVNLSENHNDIALTRVLAKKVLATLGDNASEDMMNAGLGLAYLKADGVTFDAVKCGCDGFLFASNFQNFIVGDEGLTFVMNQYQVAPYVVGMPEILLTWKDLAPFMNKDFSLPLD